MPEVPPSAGSIRLHGRNGELELGRGQSAFVTALDEVDLTGTGTAFLGLGMWPDKRPMRWASSQIGSTRTGSKDCSLIFPASPDAGRGRSFSAQEWPASS